MYTFIQVLVEAKGDGLPEVGVIGCWELASMDAWS